MPKKALVNKAACWGGGGGGSICIILFIKHSTKTRFFLLDEVVVGSLCMGLYMEHSFFFQIKVFMTDFKVLRHFPHLEIINYFP